MDQILEIRNIIAQHTEEATFDDDTALESLDIDSFEYVQIIVEIEDLFGKDLDDDVLILEDVLTVGKLIDVVMHSILNS